tara:strand:- start:36571 stop:36840 length:270 start_codon:yes stop_codon:yes gene_type:complete
MQTYIKKEEELRLVVENRCVKQVQRAHLHPKTLHKPKKHKERNKMVAKLHTIRRKLAKKQKLGFSERARAVNKGLLPSKAKKDGKKKRS